MTPLVNALKNYRLVAVVAFFLCAVGAWPRAAHYEGAARVEGSVEQDLSGSAGWQDGLDSDNGTETLARVNGVPVTRADVRRWLADPLARSQLEQELGVEEPEGSALLQLAVVKLIHRRLFLQEAGRQRLTISVQDLDQAISVLRSRFVDLGSFGVWMMERGLDDQSLFNSIRDDLLVGQVIAGLVADVAVTEQQVKDYYDSHKADLTIGEEVRLRIIAVNSSAAATEILTALRAGANFSRLARTRSLGLRAARGGDTGWVNTATLTPPLRGVVDMLKLGEASTPLQKSADEFLIVALEGRRAVHAKHLDVARPLIERRLLATKRHDTIQTWLTEQKQKTKIEIFPQWEDAEAESNMI